MAKYLVAVNCRYKDYYAVEADNEEDAKIKTSEGEGICIETYQEYADAMDSEYWDDPKLLTEDEYEEVLKGSH